MSTEVGGWSKESKILSTWFLNDPLGVALNDFFFDIQIWHYFGILSKGSFNNHVDIILLFFDHPLTSMDIFIY